MKKILFFGLMLLGLIGCEKEKVDLEFGKQPEERMGERLEELRTLLKTADNGWKGNLLVGAPGAYSFYFNFDDDKLVTMVSDFNNTTSLTPKQSTYRVRWAMNAALSFDTYNYITMLQEPSGVNGGVAPNGFYSDVEFEYQKSSGDTIYMIGKKYGLPLNLTKATKAEADAYLGGELSKSMEKTKKFFNDNRNSYVQIDSGGFMHKVGFDLWVKEKGASLSTVTAQKTVKSQASLFVFNLNGLEIYPVTFLGRTFNKAVWEGNKFILMDTEGKKYQVLNDSRPILPLNKAIGSKFSSLYSPFSTYLPGTSPDGLTILKRFHEGLGNGATGYVFNYGTISMIWDSFNQRVTVVGFASQNNGASGWDTTVGYNYTFDEATGIFRFTKRSNASGGYTTKILDQLDDFFLNSGFKLDYHYEGTTTYGKIIGVDRPKVEMTFQLR